MYATNALNVEKVNKHLRQKSTAPTPVWKKELVVLLCCVHLVVTRSNALCDFIYDKFYRDA